MTTWRRRTARWAAVLLTLTGATTTAAVTAAPADAAGEDVVLSTDFEDGTWAPWTQSGAPTLSVVDLDGGGKALEVAGRAHDYDGIQSPTGLLQPGQQYTFSMRARLAPGTAGPAQARFVVKPAYTWVGNTTITADAWTTVSGVFTAPADADPAELQVYLGTSDLSAAYTYLVDDITITGAAPPDDPWEPTPDPTFVPGGAVNPTSTPMAAARGTGKVAALTFDDGPNPGETDRLLDFLKAHDIKATFCIIGQNVQAPGGADVLRRIVAEGHTLCNHTTTYADMGSWSQAQVEADLKANLKIIRDALGDPQQKVPYFRAPNGSWGQTGEVAAALGMQPLGLGNVINDWDGNDQSVETLKTNLRNAFQPGAVILVHDGGGDRENGITAVEQVVPEKIADGWTFSLPAGGIPSGDAVVSSDFEDGLDGWAPRGDAQGDPTVAVTTEEAHGGTHSARVSDRTSQGDGIGHDLTGALTPGVTYQISAWVRFAAGEPADDLWLSMQRTGGGATSFDTVGQFTGVRNDGWTQVTATYQAPESDALFLYFETRYPDGGTGTFEIDDVVIAPQATPEVQCDTTLKGSVPFPVGVAIDERETTGAAGELTACQFSQLTPENHMKPEAWYDEEGNFRPHPQADALMRFAQEQHLRVYGHTLVWHSQTPAWFFQHDDGTALTDSAADQELLRQRMHDHIFDVAEYLATTYGEFGSDTNPLVAFDVVNEVVSDSGEYADGLRRSEWYRVLGEDYIDLAFQYADEAFNDTYAAPGSDRPVTLSINDYNTEQAGKRQRLHDLVARLIERGVPVDAVGHQFHVSLSTPVSALDEALTAFEDLPVKQSVTELDVTTGTPVTDARLVDQGYYYRDAFRVFRAHADDIFSVTVWGLNDGRSWRSSSGAPLLFDDALQPKPAFWGAVDGDLPPRQRTAYVFRSDVPASRAGLRSPEWRRLPLHPVEEVAGFQLRWAPDHLTAYVEVSDGDEEAGDAVTFTVGDASYTVHRDGSGDVPAAVAPTADGYRLVASLPFATDRSRGDTVDFDLVVHDGATETGWSTPGTSGTLTLVEPVSYTKVRRAPRAPRIDGDADAVWGAGRTVTTRRQIEGTGGATADVTTLWRGHTLYVLAEVADPHLDATGSDPWTQDSVEVFLDAGNAKNGPYRYDDMQVRISYQNVLSFGTGDEAFQRGRVESATSVVKGGYVVEAALDLLEAGGAGTFQGLDFQVNDATAGARTAVRTWADPTGLGYQSTARWGVGELVGPPAAHHARVRLADDRVRAGGTVGVRLTGWVPGSTVKVRLPARGTGSARTLGTVQVGRSGAARDEVVVPRRTPPGRYTLRARSGKAVDTVRLVVTRRHRHG